MEHHDRKRRRASWRCNETTLLPNVPLNESLFLQLCSFLQILHAQTLLTIQLTGKATPGSRYTRTLSALQLLIDRTCRARLPVDGVSKLFA